MRRDPEALLFRHEAMATWFEIHIPDEDPASAQAAASEAFLLLDRLENLLSRYREDSEVSMISRMQPGEIFRVEEDVFSCLALALSYSEATGGAFDPALGKEMDVQRGLKSDSEEKTRGRLLLDASQYLVICEGAPVSLDLGAIGKGYALDRLAGLLSEWGIRHALLGGGGSSLKTLAAREDVDAPSWSVGMDPGNLLWLRSGAVGCSGIAVQGAHIIDPVTGLSAEGSERVWVHAPKAVEADAFSTAFMILSLEEIVEVAEKHGSLSIARQAKIDGQIEWMVRPVQGCGLIWEQKT